MLDQLSSGDIRSYGTTLGAACTSVGDSSARLQGVGDAIAVERWTGPAGDAARGWHGALQAQTARFSEALNRVGSFAPKVAKAVEESQQAKKAEQQAQDAVNKANQEVQRTTSALHSAQSAVNAANARVAEWVPHGLHPTPPPGPSPAELAAVSKAKHELTTAEHNLEQAKRALQRATHAFDEAEQNRKSVTRAFATICREAASSLGVSLPNPPNPGVVVNDFLALTGFVRAEGSKLLQAIDPRHPISFTDLVGKVGALATGVTTPLAGQALVKYDRFMRTVVDDVRALTPVTPGTSAAEAAVQIGQRDQATYWLEKGAREKLNLQGLDEVFGAGAETAGRVLGGVGILGDVLTIADPNFKNRWLAAGERTVAEVNVASTAATVMPGLTSAVVGANESLDWIPGAAPWVMAGSGLVLAGTYVATHWSQTVGWVDHNVVAPFAEPVNDGVKTVDQVESDLSHGDVAGAGEHAVAGAVKTGVDVATAPVKAAVNVGAGALHDVESLASDLNPFS